MAKKPKNDGKDLSLLAKALRRSEKLERTLTKMVGIDGMQPRAEAFLKAVKKGLEGLRKEPEAPAGEATLAKADVKVANSPKPKKTATTAVSVRRERTPKIPDIAASTDAKAK